jgi:hypothetical protein|tara:strand:+ start:893 stop:1093 length:201 start_codon:yes stop_codon:yes gene_type:complete
MKDEFMDKAVKRPGAFSAKAKRAGMSTGAFANATIKRLKGKTKTEAQRRLLKQAVLARTFARYRKK